MLTGCIDADYGGRDGLGFETRMTNGVRSAGNRGSLAGSSTRVEFYPDLGYVLIVLGNTDSNGTQNLAAHVRSRLTSSKAIEGPIMPHDHEPAASRMLYFPSQFPFALHAYVNGV